jgi:hypothetical protein
VALSHPDPSPENKYGMLGEGAEGNVIGRVISARIDGDWVVVEMLITDASGLQAIEDGVHELSLGYRCRADERNYQRDTFVDHLALVDRGRCGPTCALRADEHPHCGCESRELIRHEVPRVEEPVQDCACKPVAKSRDMSQSANHMPLGTETQMDELQTQLDAAKADADAQRARADQAEEALTAQTKAREAAELEAYNAKKDLESRADAEKEAIERAVHAEKTRADQAMLERDAAHKRAEDAEAARADAVAAKDREWQGRIDALVTEKVELLALVAPLKLEFKNDAGEPIAIHAVESQKIKLAAIQHIDAEDFTGKSNDWIDCAFAGAMKRHTAAMKSRSDAAAAVVEMREQTTKNPPLTGDSAKQKADEALRKQLASQWKTPTSN